MMELPDNAKISTHSIVDLDWSASSANCTNIDKHFESRILFKKFFKTGSGRFVTVFFAGYSSNGDHYHFICPSNKTSPSPHNPAVPYQASGKIRLFADVSSSQTSQYLNTISERGRKLSYLC